MSRLRVGGAGRQKQWLGTTIMEMIMVVAIMLVLAAAAAPFASDAIGRRSLDTSAARAVDTLREAQFSAMNGRKTSRFGVHFQADRFVFFEGAAYNPADSENLEQILTDDVAISAVTITPGGACTVATGVGNCDIRFQSSRGVPIETSGAITFTGPEGLSKIISLNAAGMIDVN